MRQADEVIVYHIDAEPAESQIPKPPGDARFEWKRNMFQYQEPSGRHEGDVHAIVRPEQLDLLGRLFGQRHDVTIAQIGDG